MNSSFAPAASETENGLLRFSARNLFAGRRPTGRAKMNELRFHGSKMYVTDSGLGTIIMHDLETEKTTRRRSDWRRRGERDADDSRERWDRLLDVAPQIHCSP